MRVEFFPLEKIIRRDYELGDLLEFLPYANFEIDINGFRSLAAISKRHFEFQGIKDDLSVEAVTQLSLLGAAFREARLPEEINPLVFEIMQKAVSYFQVKELNYDVRTAISLQMREKAMLFSSYDHNLIRTALINWTMYANAPSFFESLDEELRFYLSYKYECSLSVLEEIIFPGCREGGIDGLE